MTSLRKQKQIRFGNCLCRIKANFSLFQTETSPLRRLNQKRKRKQILNSAENPLIFIFISDLPVLRGKFCVWKLRRHFQSMENDNFRFLGLFRPNWKWGGHFQSLFSSVRRLKWKRKRKIRILHRFSLFSSAFIFIFQPIRNDLKAVHILFAVSCRRFLSLCFISLSLSYHLCNTFCGITPLALNRPVLRAPRCTA